MASADQPEGPPALLDASGGELASVWTRDPVIDQALAQRDMRAAAGVLFDRERATRPVVRALAGSILGRESGVIPGRNAALFGLSVALAVDTAGAGRLAADDIAAVLEASCRPPVRRHHLTLEVRAGLGALVSGWGRRRRRDLGLAMLTDPDTADVLLAQVGQLVARVDTVGDFRCRPGTLGTLVDHLAAFDVLWPGDLDLLAGARDFRGGAIRTVRDDYLVRVPVNAAGLYAVAHDFRNCLDSYRDRVARGYLVATVYHRHQPLAAVAYDQVGDPVEISGPSNTPLSEATINSVLDLLVEAGVAGDCQPDVPVTLQERLLARVACRAAVLLAEDYDPPPDPWIDPVRQKGDVVLGLLGARARVATCQELDWMRGDVHDLDEVFEWQRIGALLVTAGAVHPDLVGLDGGALFRHTARELARQLLVGFVPEVVAPLSPTVRAAWANDPRCPSWLAAALRDAHAVAAAGLLRAAP